MRVAVCSRSFSANEFLRSELLRKYPNAYFNESGKTLAGRELGSFLSGSEMAIIALEKIDEKSLGAAFAPSVISKYGVGLDNLDLRLLKSRDIRLGWQGGINADSVAELTVFFILGGLRGAFISGKKVIAGQWFQAKGKMLKGKKIGIVGLGNVGKSLVKILQAFELEIYVNDILPDWSFITKHKLQFCELEELVNKCDLVTIHVSKNNSTKNLFNKNLLQKFKDGTVLINTSRGEVVDEEALYELLQQGKISAAIADVMAAEPFDNFKLLNHPNYFCTPHIGGSSQESIKGMGLQAIKGLSDNFSITNEFINSHS